MAHRLQSRCPSNEQLEQLVAGEISDGVLRPHLDQCQTCAAAEKRLRTNNEFLEQFVEMARAPHSGPHTAAAAQASDHSERDAAVFVIAGYQILEEIHRGGQGIVFRARHVATRREVALKAPLAGALASPKQQRRFEREIELIAGLRHPHIVTLYDGGIAADGRPYFAMEYIRGAPIDCYVRSGGGASRDGVAGDDIRRLSTTSSPPAMRREGKPGAAELADGSPHMRRVSPRELHNCLAVFLKVCEAVEYAHQRGIIHRDLKPGNIFVDDDGQPHVLDFGVAKVLQPEPREAAMTQTAEFVGTLAYAAPEQVQGDPDQIDTRTDVYALGVVLFELLTAQLPYTTAGALSEVVRTITTAQPPPPSTLSGASTRDLDTIALKCLAKERARRYQSVDALRRDLERYLNNEPIDACRDSAWYVLRKLVQRHRGRVAAVVIAACILPIFTITLGFAYRRAARAEQATAREAAELADSLADSTIQRGRLLAAAGSAATAERLLWREFLTQESGTPLAWQAHWALWELYSQQPCVATIVGSTSGQPCWPCFSPPEGKSDSATPELRILCANGAVERWRLGEPQPHTSFSLDSAPITAAIQAPDLTVLQPGNPNTAELWDLNRATRLHAFESPGSRFHVVCSPLSPDRDLLVLPDESGVVRLFDVHTGELRLQFHAHDGPITGIAFTPDVTNLATVGEDHMLHVWTLPDGHLLQSRALGQDPPRGCVLSPDARTLAVGMGHTISLLDFPALSPRGVLRGGVSNLAPQAFSADGRRLVGASAEKRILIWSVERCELTNIFVGDAIPTSVHMSTDDRWLAVGSRIGARVWELGAPGVTTALAYEKPIVAVGWSQQSDEVFAAADDGMVWSFDGQGGMHRALPSGPPPDDLIMSGALSCDGQWIATGCYDGTIRLWRHGGSQPPRLLGTPGQVNSVAFSPDSRTMAVASGPLGAPGVISLWDCETLMRVRELRGPVNRIPCVEFAPDGLTLAAGCTDGHIYVFDLQAGKILLRFHAHPSGLRTLAFSPDGRRLVSGGDDGYVKLWDAATGALLHTLEGHQQHVFAVQFSPDGRLIASGERGAGTLQGQTFALLLWDAATGRNLVKLLRHTDMIFGLAFSPDGARLASCSRDGAVLIHDLTYFDRHIAGNLESALQRAADLPVDPQRVAQLRAWARERLTVDGG